MSCQYCTTEKKCKICKHIFLDKTTDIETVKNVLDKYGVVVIQNYFKKPEKSKKRIVKWMVSISDELTEDKETWKSSNMPYGPRYGMMQTLVTHCPEVWKIREKMYPLFADLHNTKELYTSMDGASVHPPPTKKSPTKDWPHIDQTKSDPWCVQGQAVLTTSTSVFRCTPKSHKKNKEILELCGVEENSSNWLKFTPDQIEQLKEMFKFWQMPIYAPAGSVILWNSKTIHSAQHQLQNDNSWRCVVYVCMRPQDQFTNRNKTTLKRCVQECRTTNHWGTRMFGKRQGSFRGLRNRNQSLENLSENPERIGSVLDNDPSEIIKKITVN